MTATVVQLMQQVERQPAHQVAVEGPGVRITVGELRLLSNRLANAFIGLGLERGDRVAYVAQNHPEYVILEFALLKAGLVKVPLNFRLTPDRARPLHGARGRAPGGGRRRDGCGSGRGVVRR